MLILASKITGFISISAYPSLVAIHVGITSSAVGRRVFAFTAGIKMYNNHNKRKNHDNIALSGTEKLNPTEILIYKVLINSYISYAEFVLVNNILKEYNKMKKRSWNLCVIHYINVVNINRKTYKKMV